MIYILNPKEIIVINLKEIIFETSTILNDVIESLNNQLLKPKLIILNILDSTKYIISHTNSNIILNYGNNWVNNQQTTQINIANKTIGFAIYLE